VVPTPRCAWRLARVGVGLRRTSRGNPCRPTLPDITIKYTDIHDVAGVHPTQHRAYRVARVGRPRILDKTHGPITLCIDLTWFAHTCFPNCNVRSIWRASALGCVYPRGHRVGQLGHQRRSRMLDRLQLMDVSAAEVAQTYAPAVIFADLRLCTFRRRERHAHEVTVRHRAGSWDWEHPSVKELSVSPACPW